jgi:uncharacterized protein (TIGR02217 family)
MTSFHEVRFPDNIDYGATGGPEFATTVVATGAGHEKRNVNWAEALGRWDVASALKKQAQIDELIAFFRARRGNAYGFRFKDWTDYRATGQLLGTGDDAATQFQRVKQYPSGSVIEVRAITKPIAGTVKVYLELSGWVGRHGDRARHVQHSADPGASRQTSGSAGMSPLRCSPARIHVLE